MIPPDDLRAMQGLAQEVWRRHSDRVDVTMGELAYQGALSSTDSSDRSVHHVWADGDSVRAWTWLWRPATLEWQVHPDHPEALEDILDWFDENASAERLVTHIRAADSAAEARLRDRGFVFDSEAPWMRLNIRDLNRIEEPALPHGFRLRALDEYGGDISQRVAVHRASWAEFGTRVTEDTYPAVMRTWPYRSDLDFLVEAPDGSAVSFALGWYDEDNHVGELEPVGTHPDFRRLGLARAVSLFGLHRFREAGATHAIVACRGDDGHPAPLSLYESIGFRKLSRQHRFVRV